MINPVTSANSPNQSAYAVSWRPRPASPTGPTAPPGSTSSISSIPSTAAGDVVFISKEGRDLQAAILGQKRSDDTNSLILGQKHEDDQAPQLASDRAPNTKGARGVSGSSTSSTSSTSSESRKSRGSSQGSERGAKTAVSSSASPSAQQLAPDQQRQVQQLKQRDAEVHAHEQAHAAAGGAYAGMPSYSYTTGPDGQRYAVGGETPIDASPVRGNPQATVMKMEVVKAAALAPAQPSGQDMAVYSMANRIEQDAQAQERARQFQAAHPSGDGQAAQSLAANPEPSTGASPSMPFAATVFSLAPVGWGTP